MDTIQLLYIDLFCGAGGTSTGVENARHKGQKCAKVIACVNHDKNAIASHATNHPDALHFTEDIRTLDLTALIEHVKSCRLLYPGAKVVLWASLECTNFSKAKGGQPRDADSRTLAEHLFRYIEAINPDYIQIENVEEFMSWGDLDANGKPVSRDAGRLYHKWINSVKKYGYNFDHRILNAADYGAYTSRKRFFGIFACPSLPIVFPESTHAKSPENGLFGATLKKWKAVKEVLDFTNEGESIFTRKKPLADKTLERIYAGLIKFVAGGKDKFLLKYNSMGQNGRYNPPGIDAPCPVVSTQGRLQLCKVHFLAKYYTGDPKNMIAGVDAPAPTLRTKDGQALVNIRFLSKHYSGHPESKNISVEEPAHTVTAVDHHSIVNACFIQQRNSGTPEHKVIPINRPARTITATGGNQELVQPKFIQSYYGNGGTSSIEKPCPTVTTADRFGLVESCFLDMQYGNGTPSDIEAPAPTLTCNPKHHVVMCEPWLMNTNFANVGSDMESPAPTITANRKWHYLMNPQFASAGGSVDNPCFTLIARMDKMPPYLVVTETGAVAIEVYETDSIPMRKIKEFMALYGIVDIKMRMLLIDELKQIMGFGKNYKLIGTQAEQKKYIGNAVEVNMARVLCEALVKELTNLKQAA